MVLAAKASRPDAWPECGRAAGMWSSGCGECRNNIRSREVAALEQQGDMLRFFAKAYEAQSPQFSRAGWRPLPKRRKASRSNTSKFSSCATTSSSRLADKPSNCGQADVSPRRPARTMNVSCRLTADRQAAAACSMHRVKVSRLRFQMDNGDESPTYRPRSRWQAILVVKIIFREWRCVLEKGCTLCGDCQNRLDTAPRSLPVSAAVVVRRDR